MTFYRKETNHRTIRHATMLEVNEFLVLDHVRANDPTTRTEIARALGLSAASVSRIIGRLKDDGLVTESGTATSPGGRPSTLISFRRDAGAVIAVDLGGTRCHSALADLAGTLVHEALRPARQQGDPFQTLTAAIEETRAEAQRLGLPVVALAVGIPGVIDPERGVARAAPNAGWDGFPLVERLAEFTEIPFVVDNDVNLAALAHAWRGDARHVDSFVTISIGTGTGAAIVSGGQILKGRHNAAGEIGHLVLAREQLRQPLRGQLGVFESFASGPGIANRARELLTEANTAARPSSLAEEGEVTAEAVFAAAAAGDGLAHQVVDELLDVLAMGIVALVCVVDPELVVLDGAVGRSLEPYVEELAGRIRSRVPSAPDLRVSRLGRDATVLGAVAAALQLARKHDAPSVLGTFETAGVGSHVL